ncbi:transposase [Kaistella flava (ex Peng et al. 2021)]|uniref:Transposase n=1 Tax=Kaistella flava (ex Peng et al. 2021) TaxID=2038776 RepID=A0A7M2Y704_9FLAO|nr:transposase [Kaistella flava (ex Peng et al. 2021)]QOW09866.1 transposase [Kaistella flava (ex Peng et al. 2021)]
MKNYRTYLGIDVAKLTLDYCLVTEDQQLERGQLLNTQKSLNLFLKDLKKGGHDLKEMLFVFENTGIYSSLLSLVLSETELDYAQVPALEIKRSLGITRGKSDKVDAKEIAYYAKRNTDKITLSVLPELNLQQLKIVFAEREKTIAAIKVFERTMENEMFLSKEVFGSVKAINRQTVKHLKKQLAMLDDKIKKLIREDEVLYKQQQLLKSIPGIGEITSVYLLMVTKGFTAFTNGRKFACYSGVAPFEHTSGTSIKGKTRVSHLADKKMKSLLHMVSLTAIKYDPELKDYYTRKKAEGKHTMLVLNNIKCKIVYRIFAVIQRESNFVNLQKFAA